MGEYIKRETVLAEAQEVYHWCGHENRYGDFIPVEAICGVPAADVVEVKHGRWVENSHDSYDDMREEYVRWYTYTCSECDGEAMNDYNYCPNCGAKMDAEGGLP